MQAFCESREGRLDSYGRRKRDTQRQPRVLDDNINLREMFKVYETRDEISENYNDDKKEEEDHVQPRKSAKRDQHCLSDVEYFGIVTTIVVSTIFNAVLKAKRKHFLKKYFQLLIIIVILMTITAGACYRKALSFSHKLSTTLPSVSMPTSPSRLQFDNGRCVSSQLNHRTRMNR